MSAVRRRETTLQRNIELALGAERDLVLMRNNVGVARHTDDDGKMRHTRYGLGVGSPDLVGILAPHGRVVAFEVKDPAGRVEDAQLKSHALWRMFGAFVAVVRSVDDARDALEQARKEQAKS